MHVPFDPQKVSWTLYTDSQVGGGAVQLGGYPYFRGLPYQRGAGLGSVFRHILQRYLIPMGKQIGREGLEAGHRVLGGLLAGTPAKEAVVTEGASAVRNLLDKASTHLAKRAQKRQIGEGTLGKFRKDINSLDASASKKAKRTLVSLVPPPTSGGFTNYLRPTTPTPYKRKKSVGTKKRKA
jgi:hypothetical protein